MSIYRFNLPESLKQASKRSAAANETTMNQFFVVAIAEKGSTMKAAAFFERRAAIESKAKADHAWGKVLNAPTGA